MANLKEEKCLIDYYSREGNSYVSGRIVNLPIGNTKVVANIIQEMTGGDVFRIDTIKSYPEDYTEATNVAKKNYMTMLDRSSQAMKTIWTLIM